MTTTIQPRVTVRVSADLAQILPAYLDHRTKDTATLAASLTLAGSSELDRARTLGHQLKGSGTSFGLEEVSRLGASLEEASKRGDLAGARAIVGSLDAYFHALEVVFDDA